MRTVSLKSLCLLAGFLVPCLGTTSRAEAGVIPWLYNSIFGYGWGHNYGGGYGGGMPYSVGYRSMGYGYGGYGGYGYSAYTPSYAPAYSNYNYGYSSVPSSCGCSSGISSAPVMSNPTIVSPTPVTPAPGNQQLPPSDGNYQAHYGPVIGSYDYSAGYSPGYVVDSGSCCDPCLSCVGGDCATSINSSRQESNPTPVEPASRGTLTKPLGKDDFNRPGEPTREGPGNGGSQSGQPEESMPPDQTKPMKKLNGSGELGGDQLEPPVESDVPKEHGESHTDRSIAVRYTPSLKRSPVAIPTSVARVVRVDRTTSRVQMVRAEVKSQLAAKP